MKYKFYCFFSFWLFLYSLIYYFYRNLINPFQLFVLVLPLNIYDIFKIFKTYFTKPLINKKTVSIIIFIKILYHFIPFFYLPINLKKEYISKSLLLLLILILFYLIVLKINNYSLAEIYSKEHFDKIEKMNLQQYLERYKLF